jgi:hypothetical protein
MGGFLRELIWSGVKDRIREGPSGAGWGGGSRGLTPQKQGQLYGYRGTSELSASGRRVVFKKARAERATGGGRKKDPRNKLAASIPDLY